MRNVVMLFREIVITLVFVFAYTSAVYTAELQIKLGYSDVEAFPFQIKHDAQHPGIAFEIINRVVKELGIEVVFIQLPNKRVLHALQQGEIDGAFMYSYKPEREINGQYPMKDGKADDKKRIATLSYFMYTLKNSPLQWDGTTLSGVDFHATNNKIGANTGYSIVDDLIKKGIDVDDGARTTEQNFQKLLNKRIIGYAHQNLVADNYIRLNNLTPVEKLPIPLVTKTYFLMFSHQFMQRNPLIAEKIWSKIAEFRDNMMKEISHKYLEL